MKTKTILVAIAATFLMSTSAFAQHYRGGHGGGYRHHGGWGPGAVFAGVLAGAIVGDLIVRGRAPVYQPVYQPVVYQPAYQPVVYQPAYQPVVYQPAYQPVYRQVYQPVNNAPTPSYYD